MHLPSRSVPTALALLFLLLTVECPARSEAGTPPNVLLILVDTLRHDHLGAYGYERPTSPFIDDLARGGTVFLRAYSVSSFTPPAVASLFTGTRPRTVDSSSNHYMRSGIPTLAERFRAAGYATAAFVANPHISRRRSFDAGFDTFHSGMYHARAEPRKAKFRAERLNPLVLPWLRRQLESERPWFLYVHYMEPHMPYAPDARVARRFWRHDEDVEAARERLAHKTRQYSKERMNAFTAREHEQLVDLYDAEIAHVDAAVRELVSTIPAAIRKRTIVCLTSDHGEEFADHGEYLHSHSLFEELIRIPLIVDAPDGLHLPAQETGIVQISDVPWILLDLAGATDTPANEDRPSIRSGASWRRREVLAEIGSRTRIHSAALIRDNYKLIVGKDGDAASLFRLDVDQSEQKDVARSQATIARELRDALRRLESDAAEAKTPVPTIALDANTREQLKMLGYE